MGKHDRNHLIFSPSGLGTFRDCLRCGYLEYHARDAMDACPRPRGIQATLPNGIDKVVKKYHDAYRAKKILPPYLVGSVAGILYPDQKVVQGLRYWNNAIKTTIQYGEHKVTIRGALDDLILREDSHVSILDSKSKGFPTKDDGSQYYQTQLDCYDLMLSSNGYKTTGIGYLAYVWPGEMQDPTDLLCIGASLRLDARTYTLKTDADRARATILAAADVILNDALPEPSPTCEYCQYVENRNALEERISAIDAAQRIADEIQAAKVRSDTFTLSSSRLG